MASSLATVIILALALSASVVRADVSHLGYNRYTRPASTRLQRLESNPTPYPAAGFRPNREFNLPRERPQLALNNNQQSSSGFDVLSEPQQPQVTYGAPARFRQAPARLQQVYSAPQLTYGAPEQSDRDQQSGFDKLSETQQRPNALYNAPSRGPQDFEPTSLQPQNSNSAGFDNLGEPQQRPNLLYAAPARLRQAPARLQQYQSARLAAIATAQSSRLTDNREDEEDEEDTANPNAEIETVNKKENSKKAAQPAQNVATVAYYPAGAFSFVQPVNGAYVAAAPSAAFVAATPNAAFLAAAPKAVYPSSAALVAAPAPFVQQPFTLAPIQAAAPAQLRAW